MDLSEFGLDPEVIEFLNSQNDFEIDRISQEGGNCDIFFGYHKIFERRIALKIYYGNDVSSSHNEPRILSRIDHENILKVRDAKRIGKYHSYFMTDEISGGDLEKFFQDGKLDLAEKLNVIHGILNGLTELHKPLNSILHRDLKPKNILIYEENKQPLISDFGSIKHFDKNIGHVKGSKTTSFYIPKEVFEQDSYSVQSDIYQVGVIMFQILGGFFPGASFEWLNEKEKKKFLAITGAYERDVYLDNVIHKRIRQNSLLRFDTLPNFIHPEIIKVIKKATNPSLKIRYANTGAFMGDLYKVQKKITNWRVDGNLLYATKANGDSFRINSSRKGFYIEKDGNSGWRRQGEFSDTIDSLIKKINR